MSLDYSRRVVAWHPLQIDPLLKRAMCAPATGTSAWSLGTDTLHRVLAWCLSPSEPGQAHHPLHRKKQRVPGTMEPVPEQYVEAASGEPTRQHAPEAHAGLSQPGHPLFPDCNGSHGGCSRSGHEQ